MALTLDGTTGITSDSGTPVIENLNTTDTGIDITGQLTTTGNVGIGTSSPTRNFHLVGDGTTTPMRVDSGAGASLIDFKDAATTADFKVRVGAIGDNFAAYAGGTERLRIDSAGRVTMPYQPFFAGYHTDQYATNFDNSIIIPVSNAISNVGNHFNTSTYTFTVPVSGVYEVIMTDISNLASATAALAVYVNGTLTTKAYTQSVRHRFHASMLQLTANDAVTFRVGEGSCTLYGAGSYGRYQIRLIG